MKFTITCKVREDEEISEYWISDSFVYGFADSYEAKSKNSAINPKDFGFVRPAGVI